MSRGRGAQLGDVNGLGEIHLKQRALAESERDRVLRVLRGFFTAGRGKLLHGGFGALHREFVVVADSGSFDFRRRVEPVDGRESLHDLDAAAVAVHVAEAADVHEDVEAELLAGGERTRHLVVAAAMAQAEVDDFTALRFASRSDCLAKLPIRIMTVTVQERGGKLDLERVVSRRIVIHQINQRRRLDGGVSHQFGGGLLEFATRLDFIAIRIGVLDQRGRDPHFAQEFAFGAIGDFGRHGANLGNQGAQGFFVRVVRRRNGCSFQQRSEITDFFMRLREEVRNLGLECPGVDDLPE